MSADQVFIPLLEHASNDAEFRINHPLLPDDPRCPIFIYYAAIKPNRREYLTPSLQQRQNINVSELKINALQNWVNSHHNLEWEQVHVAGSRPIMKARAESGTISTIMLSHGHLKGMHKYFGSDMVHVAVPDIHEVYISDDVAALRSHVQQKYQKALNKTTALCPNLYTSLNGVIKGFTVPNHEERKTEQFNNEEEVLPMIQKLMAKSYFIFSHSGEKYHPRDYQTFLVKVTELAGQEKHLIHQASEAAVKNNFTIFQSALEEIEQQGLLSMVMLIQKVHDRTNRLEFAIIKHHIINLMTQVAETTGGILGIGSKISKIEKQAIEAMTSTFAILGD